VAGLGAPGARTNQRSIRFRCLGNPELATKPVANPRNQIENVILDAGVAQGMRASSGYLLQTQVEPKLLVRPHREVGTENHKVYIEQLSDLLQCFSAVAWDLDQI
jgi:hypothetical protein